MPEKLMNTAMHAGVSQCLPLRLAATTVAILFTAVTLSAQTTGSGVIEGRVFDETGGALPGVGVSAKSPALQTPVVTAVTNGSGEYRFVDLPAGVYSITFELAGFQTVVMSDFRLNVGFVARLDRAMKIGSIEEAVTVSGQGPIVDLSTTANQTNFTKETLDELPTTRSVWQVLSMAPGIRMQSVDIAGSQLATQQTYKNYGTSGNNMPYIEGVNAQQAGAGIGGFFDYNTFEEVQIAAVGNDASSALPGTNLQVIVKSGGNDFHGAYAAAGTTDELQSTNVDDAQRSAGVTNGNTMRYTYDSSADLGGRVIRDKLWFYGAYRNQKRVTSVPGYSEAPGPDRRYGTSDDVPGESPLGQINYTGKASYQANSRYKVVGFYLRAYKDDPQNGASRFRPFETTMNYHSPFVQWKGELQGAPTSTTLFSVLFGNSWYRTDYAAQVGSDRPDNPSILDRNTGIYSGATPLPFQRPRWRRQMTGWLSAFPERSIAGRHSLKAGYQLYWQLAGNTAYVNKAAGNYLLTYDLLAGVRTPVQLDTYNSPIVDPQNRADVYAVYGTDSWRVNDRLTVNLGVRFDRYHSYVGEQEKIQGTFGTSGIFPPVEVKTENLLAPRLGMAYDLGGGRSVIKATYGRYYHGYLEDFAGNFNQNTLTTTSYRWRDPDRNGNFTPGEVNLDVNGPDFISVSGASSNVLNPDIESPYTDEASLGFERALSSVLAVKGLYVYKREDGLHQAVNILRPFSAYNIPLTRRDPGADGALNTADDAGSVTFYDYDPAYRGSRFVANQFQNQAGARDNSFHSIEITVNKRQSRRWSFLSSVSATKNQRWLVGIPQSPNDEFFPLDETWDWQFKLTGAYTAPGEVLLSSFFQSLAGVPGQRTYVFRTADPDGGTPIAQSNTITLRLAPFGDERTPTQNVLNLRASKRFEAGVGRLEVRADLFNALNANVPTAQSYVSGPSFGGITAILPPRVLQFGATFSF
jgi:outer membrane receptor protein involved in Fe transport